MPAPTKQATDSAGEETGNSPSAGRQVAQAGPGMFSASVGRARISGYVSKTQSPFLSGSVQTIPAGEKIELTFMGNLNSELTQKGEEVMARVSVAVKDGEKVLLPNGWYLHGLVTDTKGQRRLGRDGFVEVEFDKLVSPDGQWELPFGAKYTTADNTLKAVSKIVAFDTLHCTKGAIVGSLLSVQMTGLPVAISTYGISVGVGAGVGASIALIGALKRKGNIASLYPGDQKTLTISEPLTLPGFNLSALPLPPLQQTIKGLDLQIVSKHFGKDPNGDRDSRLLTLGIKMDNQTEREFSFFTMAVVSDHDQRYFPYPLARSSFLSKKVPPKSAQEGTVTFSVDNPKHKYWLVVLDKGARAELARVPVN